MAQRLFQMEKLNQFICKFKRDINFVVKRHCNHIGFDVF